MRTTRSAALVLLLLLSPALAWSQSTVSHEASNAECGLADQQQTKQSGSAVSPPTQSDTGTQSKADTAAPAPAPVATPTPQRSDSPEAQQTNRMFWIVPNFAAVSANMQLPRLTTREKFWIATKDSVDYTSFIWAGVLAGQGFALKSYPELHQGMTGYSRYYWRAFVDQASGAYFTEAIVPALTHEDPRYYTLGHGGVFRRTAYALSQLVLTKMDSGKTGFNFSEILGNGMEAGVANLYYPPQERGFRKTADNWAVGIESAALNNVVKEFWPDIRQMILSIGKKKD